MGKIPEWQYPLYEESDRKAYSLLERTGRSGRYPELIGTRKQIGSFLKAMILSQGARNYRGFRDLALDGLGRGSVIVPEILKNGGLVSQEADRSWAVFMQDKRICELMDRFGAVEMEFRGDNREVAEFVVRFLLSQLLQDWRGPLMAVVLECLENRIVKVSELNDMLKIWDYTGIFI
jgi:hypothetical protein